MIIQDTREKNPWIFMEDIKIQKLCCGDYTTSTLYEILRVERKATTGELYLNLGKKTNKDRFYREIEKLKKFPKAFIVCEFPESYLYEFPKNSGIPQKKLPSLRMSAAYLRKLVREINEHIPVVFTNSKREAEDYLLRLIADVEAEYGITRH